MNREQVRELEALVEQALAEAFRQLEGEKRLPRYSPDARMLHLMAKAAVTVLEAAEREGE